jgi:single-strand DNA-binding protein
LTRHNFASSKWLKVNRTSMNTLKNKVNLIGRLGAKPVMQAFESGAKKMRLSVATNERYKNKKGEWEDNTQWHTVIAWGKLCDRIEKVLNKGSEVVIEGRIVNRSYETKEGEKRFSTEIELNEFVVLNSKKQENN